VIRVSATPVQPLVAPPGDLDTVDASTHTLARLALIAATVAMLMISFVTTATNIAVPSLEKSFNAPLSSVSWVVTSYNVCHVTLMLVGGRLADRRGRKRVFLTGLAVFSVGAAASTAAPTLWLLVAARIVQAVGAAMVLPASLVAVLPTYPRERHASIVSLWSSMSVAGSAVGPTISSVVLASAGWRSVFALAIPFAVVAMVLAYRAIPESQPEIAPGPLDVIGAAAGTLAVGGFAIALVQGRVWGWSSTLVLTAAATAIVAGFVFVRRSLHHAEPLVDLRVLGVRSFVVTASTASIFGVASGATWFLYPLFMRQVWGYSILRTGIAMSPGATVMVFVTLASVPVATRMGYRRSLTTGATIALFGVVWLAVFLRPGSNYWTSFVPATLLIGIGMGLSVGQLNAAALRAVEPGMLGAANGAFNTLRSLGSALGVAMVAAVLGATRGSAREDAFALAFALVAALMAIAPVLLAFGYRNEPS
jgi:EmrB/QacA subfamily drug resistance transporter